MRKVIFFKTYHYVQSKIYFGFFFLGFIKARRRTSFSRLVVHLRAIESISLIKIEFILIKFICWLKNWWNLKIIKTSWNISYTAISNLIKLNLIIKTVKHFYIKSNFLTRKSLHLCKAPSQNSLHNIVFSLRSLKLLCKFAACSILLKLKNMLWRMRK